MIFLIVSLLLIIGLFLVAYFSKRRLCLLGLALTAGYTLSLLWSYESGIFAGILGFDSSPIVLSITSLVLMLIPVIIVLINGYSYNLKLFRLIGSLVFVLIFVSLASQVVGPIIPDIVSSNNIFIAFEENKYLITSFGLILTLADLLISKPTIVKKGRSS